MRYYREGDIIYKIGTARFRELCSLGMAATARLNAIDEGFSEQGISTEGWTSEDYKNAIESLGADKYYGIELNVAEPDTECVRIGDLTLHRTLPVHARMRGCLLDDDGTVIKYLNSEDWTAETRDGSSGQVMVEVPEHWVKYETDGSVRRVYVSTSETPTFTRIPTYYVGAYEATLNRSTNTLCSIVNSDPNYRGGNNTSDWDTTTKSLLGRPTTYRTLNQFLLAARRRASGYNWNIVDYNIWKDLIWLYVIEYANLNVQEAYTGERTAEGYRQGGLGLGVTGLNYSTWTNWNSNNPFIPCGYTDSLGNSTGTVSFQLPEDYNPGSTLIQYVPRWRGIENMFGHIREFICGCFCNVPTPTAGGDSKFYIVDSPENYTTTYGITDHAIEVGVLPRFNGYITNILFGDHGDIVPTNVRGGTSATYFSDQYSTYLDDNYPDPRPFLASGPANSTGEAGLFAFLAHYGFGTSYRTYGSRLCYLTEI